MGEQGGSGGGKGAGHSFSEVEKATSEKWKKLILRNWTFLKNMLSVFFRTQVLRSRNSFYFFFFWTDRFRVKIHLNSGSRRPPEARVTGLHGMGV